MFFALELAVGAMAALGTVMLNSEKKAASSHKDSKGSEDLDASELKYPENEEGE